MKAWVNGSIRSASDASISAFDHGLTVGDGVFETLKVVRGVPFALRRHLSRLAMSSRGLGLPEPDLDVVRRAIKEALAANAGSAVGRLRITWTAGPAPLGSERSPSAGTLIVAVGPASNWPATESVVVVPWTRNERSAVAGLKTTSYAENVVALAHAHERHATEALFADTKVFVVIKGELLTPSLACGCLPGVTRALVLEWCGGQEAELPLSALHDADEVFLTSSTRDIIPVARIDAHGVPSAPGTITAHARQLFGERSAADLDP
jgi:branched-chain amino acid aminotransferase